MGSGRGDIILEFSVYDWGEWKSGEDTTFYGFTSVEGRAQTGTRYISGNKKIPTGGTFWDIESNATSGSLNNFEYCGGVWASLFEGQIELLQYRSRITS